MLLVTILNECHMERSSKNINSIVVSTQFPLSALIWAWFESQAFCTIQKFIPINNIALLAPQIVSTPRQRIPRRYIHIDIYLHVAVCSLPSNWGYSHYFCIPSKCLIKSMNESWLFNCCRPFLPMRSEGIWSLLYSFTKQSWYNSWQSLMRCCI